MGAENLFQQEAGHQLQHRGQHDGAEKQGDQTAGHGGQAQHHDQHPKAVNGAVGTVEKATVDEFAGIDGGIDHLHAPAQDGVNKKAKYSLVHGQHDKISSSSTSIRKRKGAEYGLITLRRISHKVPGISR